MMIPLFEAAVKRPPATAAPNERQEFLASAVSAVFTVVSLEIMAPPASRSALYPLSFALVIVSGVIPLLSRSAVSCSKSTTLFCRVPSSKA
jgi:hypothetical protein